MEGTSREFLPYWFAAEFLSEYFSCWVIIASIFVRNFHKTRILESLYICELDESKEALKIHQNILVPLQNEIQENKFNETLLADTSNIISQKGGFMYNEADCTFTNSEIESNYNQKGSKYQGLFSDQDSMDSGLPHKFIASNPGLGLKRRKTEKYDELKKSYKSELLAAEKTDARGLVNDSTSDNNQVEML